MAILGGIALIAFAAVYLLDHYVTGGRGVTTRTARSAATCGSTRSRITDALAGLAAA